ncbi:Thioredoxin-like protein CITRX, chloroplastic [Quillaja saponaria]|uniref:Thioredoxin-like protein CITRX, chloroplastic n=1 Tax=Quillaja saponaria TaxID=32244 RepID=A0AAD7L2K4_QUISA|nr:Thioredoxin-like protein CITRX, chloroplastic [Quillaja saponaria]
MSLLHFHSTHHNIATTLSPVFSSCKKPYTRKHVREDYLVKKLSAHEIQELVRGEINVPLIIDFCATWCGPCILLAQELEMLAV